MFQCCFKWLCTISCFLGTLREAIEHLNAEEMKSFLIQKRFAECERSTSMLLGNVSPLVHNINL
jgi:hypothetical protein